jgi:hypothetical protein
MPSMTLIQNFTKTTIESWFIPRDIIMITFNILAIILAMLFLIIIILDKTCQTVPMLLVANSCFATFIFESTMLSTTIFTLQNDLKQIEYQYSLCVFLGYFISITCAMHNYSFLLQAIYRYFLIVHPTRLFWQSKRIEILFICISWIIAIVSPMEYLFTGQIISDVNN